jgi:D-cysteine desulfhydrase
MAALLHDAPSQAGQHVLFWMTARGQALQPPIDWRQRLPEPLAQRLGERSVGLKMTRRHFLMSGGMALAATALGCQDGGSDRKALTWHGTVLSAKEALVLAAAAEALLPHTAGSPDPLRVAHNVDRYLLAVPESDQRLIHMLFLLIEHGTPLGGHLRRFTRLGLEDRLAFLSSLRRGGSMLAQAYRCLRDLCLLGYYQEPSTWDRIGYGGPWITVHGGEADSASRYEAMRAPKGSLPKVARS